MKMFKHLAALFGRKKAWHPANFGRIDITKKFY
jgi:hypothetical protein